MNILAIGAHPDDIEFGCAPILIKEIKKGNQVKYLVLSKGEAGSSGTPDIREQESLNAARVTGATIQFLDFGGDCKLRHDPEFTIQIAREIRIFSPEIILAPHTAENQHPDHIAAGKLARDACRLARYGGLEELKPFPTHKTGNLYFYNITQHGQQRPDIVIDIAAEVETWVAAMNCHATQVKSKGYIDLQLAGARLLGLNIGVEYAAGLFINDPVRVESLSDLTLSARNF